MQNLVSFEYDDYISENTCFVAALSDYSVVYGDDFRYGKNDFAWRRLKKYCEQNNLCVVKLNLRLRSHWVVTPLPENAEGYWFRLGALCNLANGQTQLMYKVGYTDGAKLYKFGYTSPELELQEEETMVVDLDLNDESLILRGE